MVQYSGRGCHPVSPGHQGQPGLMPVLKRQSIHFFFRYIGRITYNKVEDTLQARKKIRLPQGHPVNQSVPVHVPGSHRQRVGRNVCGQHPTFRKGPGEGYRHATAARANL